jgi:predicted DNA-binding transcriptional regulator YafY
MAVCTCLAGTKARQMLSKGEVSADDVASMLKVSRRTLFRELRATRARGEAGIATIMPTTSG